MPTDQGQAPAEVSVREFRENLAGFLRKARQGERFVVTSHGEPVAQLGPPTPPPMQPRPFGLLRGQIRMAPDFDQTPADLIAEMEGDASPGDAR
jgi:prevent-host-death family protein